MEKRPSFQFYPKDVLSDAEAMSMPNEAFGIYFKLLCYDWVNDGIPNDKKTIMRIAGFDWTDFQGNMRDPEDYDTCLNHVCSKFIAHPSKKGFLTNPRLLKERKKQDDFIKKKENAGKKGAEKRWGKPKKKPIAKNSTPIVSPLAKDSSSSSSSSSSNKKKKKQKENTPSEIAKKFFNREDLFQHTLRSLTEKGAPEEQVRAELEKFVSYWTEPNKSGTKVRWEMQKTFEVSRRLATWFGNAKGFKKTSTPDWVKSRNDFLDRQRAEMMSD